MAVYEYVCMHVCACVSCACYFTSDSSFLKPMLFVDLYWTLNKLYLILSVYLIFIIILGWILDGDRETTLVRVNVWWRQASIHHLKRCLTRYLTPSCIARPQRVHTVCIIFDRHFGILDNWSCSIKYVFVLCVRLANKIFDIDFTLWFCLNSDQPKRDGVTL